MVGPTQAFAAFFLVAMVMRLNNTPVLKQISTSVPKHRWLNGDGPHWMGQTSLNGDGFTGLN